MALLLTMIGRVVDGLPLAASMSSDEQVKNITTLKITCVRDMKSVGEEEDYRHKYYTNKFGAKQ